MYAAACISVGECINFGHKCRRNIQARRCRCADRQRGKVAEDRFAYVDRQSVQGYIRQCMGMLTKTHTGTGHVSVCRVCLLGCLAGWLVCLFVCPSVRLSVGPSVRRSSVGRGRSVGLSVCRSVGLSVCRSAGLPVCRFVGLSVCLSVCLCVG